MSNAGGVVMSDERISTVRLQELSWRFTETAVLFGAVEVGFFTKVSSHGRSVGDLAAALGMSYENAERMAKACVSIGLINRTGDGFENAPDVERYLVEGKPTYAGSWIGWFHNRWDQWGKLGEHLGQDRPEEVMGHYTPEFTEDFARRYHEATNSVGMGAARWFVKNYELDGRHKLLDLGGGSGAYSIVAAQRYPELTAIVLDLPEVVPITLEFIEEHGVADRVTAQACDFTSDPLPEGSDVILMNSNLPMYGSATISEVVQKAFDALEPGGEMHVCGEMLNEDWNGPLIPVMCGLHGALDGSTAKAHTPSECIGYFEDAGFLDVAVSDFVPEILKHISGTKPC
ncbi:MAG: methyltransferase domain-containing protein [Actinomycetia bacterium]|nr:methyltransferase domain-containing protein [Actinomycetes bacterium]